MNRRAVLPLMAAALSLGLGVAPAMAEYPERPIEMIVPWGAGGGTDAVGRIFAQILQEELGKPVNVVNRTGGSGVVGHSAISRAKPDGYTIGVMTIEIDMMHWQGLTDLTYKDFDILALVNADPGGIMVAEDAPWKDAAALRDTIKADPAGTVKASGTGQGGIWHLNLLGWLMSEGIPVTAVPFVPSQGAAAGLTDMVAGGVQMVPSSLAEGRSLIDAKRVRALASMSDERQSLFPDTPTLKEATGSDWKLAVWRAIAAPKDMPPEARAKLIEAIEKAYNSDAYQNFMKERGFGLRWAGPEEATQIVAADDASLGDVMKKAGLAK
ncbi:MULTISPECIES: tripartite tricarboxylate transporter substrate binding protein [Paracoccus]|jgi:tripartite-type tricarboxylate transporter receptor subunit TctC|uniref:Tripartite tricarboxylate transporter substrate binding protein n=1 Tax=Paracoccus litorisediminis TaxID=2006130 RepID=A0A844HH46_9RHOB|nr:MULTISPECIES: tripartite tricarboxylate transporter substrate binding protein [Paracoccus]MBD9528160.1 tripartite tricarboxylate transporter substrate binding protein [Paracoccus sp. PAR01]MTH59136.1 tripartite tricarboxylate transporter substrate binding protein [Paracoccus litorisediminis]